ncbi:sulfatase [Labilibaculum filiforme]|uniref:Sulfatase n=1 Tax=Labilibaculum filiforme TaxID=1940526 RepID=A0A2N3HTG6_9BACT|nr:sulfatase [Labilibaculum filiforme]PKQ61337.1 sulfatase [Labilibaculum filiforme]
MKKYLLVCGLFLALFTVKAQEKPNIIWLMAEDMSLDLECYGMPAVKTPNLNKMAEQGVRFDNCFVTNSICSPSRSAMMVGTHQLKINAHNHRSNRDVPLNENFKPFTSLLKDAGYTCVLGNHAVMKLGRKIDVNFKHEALGNWDGKTEFGLFDKYDNFEKEDQPFFAQIQLVASHRGDWWNEVRNNSAHPVNPDSVVMPAFMADHPVVRLDWAKYLDQVEFLDNEIGLIFKELEEKGMAENTIVIFIGDNGRCNIRGKGYLQDPGLRIPFIVYSPIKLPGAKVRKDVVASIDITATVLDFAGIEIPDYMTGKPIFDKKFKREYTYAARDLWDEIQEKIRAITSNEWKYIRNDKPEIPYDAHQAYLEFYRPAVHIMRTLKQEGKLTPAQELFFADSKPKEELYNLKNDPQELNNLATNPKYAKILDKMRKETLKYDEFYTPVSDVFEPEHPGAVDVFEWLKKEKPEQYQEMLNGVEIGLHELTNEYKKSKKK